MKKKVLLYLFFIAFSLLSIEPKKAFSTSSSVNIPPPPSIKEPSPPSNPIVNQPRSNTPSKASPTKRKVRRKKKSKPSALMAYKESLILFQWRNEQEFSIQWAYGFLKQKDKFAPPLLKEKITDKFKNDTMIYLNFHQNILQFPYILKWGLKGSAGLTRNYDHEKTYFFPLSLSIITSLQIFKEQLIVPFFEMGYSTWNIDFSEFSEFFPFWSLGASVSLSLFKPSLRHTMPDEYGIRDIGIIVEVRNHSSPMDLPDKKRGYFLHSVHTGIYFSF